MALEIIDLFQDWTVSYPSGTENSGNGAALPPPSSGFSTWKQDSAPPNGFTQCPRGIWAHGNYVYVVYNGTDGLGNGIYRFSVDSHGNFTYDSFVAQSALGLVMGNWGWPPCFYDSSDGSVILITNPTSGTGNTPIAGKWLCSSWPFSNTNKEWFSSLAQSSGSYVSGQVTDEPRGYLGGAYLFVVSSTSGQIHTLDPSSGSVLGTWCYNPVYSAGNQFKFFGENAAGNPIGGSYYSSGGAGNVYAWDISDLDNWVTTGDILLKDTVWSYTQGLTPHYKRAKNRLYSTYWTPLPVSKHEITTLGLTGCMIWMNVRQYTRQSEPHLIHYDPDTDEYRECLTANGATRRAIGNFSYPGHPGFFFLLNGIPWFLSWSEISQDQEHEDPGGALLGHYGICLTPIGPGVVKYTKTAPADRTPKRIQPTVAPGAKNYLCSESYQKCGVRFQNVTKATGWTNWRFGEQELSALDQVINGKDAWGAWDQDDELEIEHRIYAGWPQPVDQTVYQNPGGGGDPDQLPTNTADVGPPREVRLMLFCDTAPRLIGL